jgi:beta-glucosidase
MSDQPFYRNKSLTPRERTKALLVSMTLSEKCQQLQYHYIRNCSYTPEQLEKGDFDREIKNALEKGLGNIFIGSNNTPEEVARTIQAFQQYLKKYSPSGIPLFVHCESLHGLMGAKTTIFPQAPALAASWDRDLIERVFEAVARESRARGIHITYAPVLDIVTDARWGRSQEAYGEDPYLNSEIGMACIKGYQGGSHEIGEDRIISTAKHFAGYGQGIGGRNFAPSPIPRREMLNNTLRPFRKVVTRGGMMGIMAAHQEIDGVPCHCNKELLTQILREQWGFKGLVISDADDIYRLHAFHKVAETEDDATLMALDAGVDVEILRSHSFLGLERLVNEGKLKESDLDKTVGRVLLAKFEMGLFDTESFAEPEKAQEISFSEAHRTIAKEASDKGIVLLENKDDILPLKKDKIKSISVIGPNARQLYFGTYSPKTAEGISPYDGLEEKCQSLGIEIKYAKGCTITNIEKDEYETELDFNIASNCPELVSDEDNEKRIQEAVEVAESSDVAVLCLGSNLFTSREAVYMNDHRGDRDEIGLPGSQELLIKRIARTGTPIILFLFNGRPLSTAAVSDDIQGLFCCWALGCETGRTVADVLFGDVNPSGKMTLSVPAHVGQIPVYYNQDPSGMFRNYLFSDNKPLYQFGDGLSYTTFSYANLTLSETEIIRGENLFVTVDVTNTGYREGDEVVQLYIRDDYSAVCRPVLELAGFDRIHLKPGETKQVSLPLTNQELGYYGPDYSFVVEPGTFTISCGPNLNNLLSATLSVK